MMRWMIFAPLMVLSSLFYGQVPDYVPTNGLVAWYPFNGNYLEHFSNEQGADLNVAFIPDRNGVENGALQFNGDGSVHFDSGPWMDWSDENSWSISCWFNVDEPHHGSVFEKWFALTDNAYPFNLRVNTEDELSAGMYPGVNSEGTSVVGVFDLNTWTHAVITYNSDSRVLSLYVGGVLASTEVLPDGDYVNADPFYIGRRQNESSRYFHGAVDDVAFFDRILNSSEIEYLASNTPFITGCTEASACNYNPLSFWDDGSCEFSCLCLNGTIWDEELGGCVPANTCPQDLNYDGIVGTDDLLVLLSTFGFPCQPEVTEWSCGEPVSYHGYDYETVLIGGQCWFAENLRTEQYQNGDSIPDELTDTEWSTIEAGAMARFPEGHEHKGHLYNFYAVLDERNVCPQNWHVSTDNDWLELEAFMCMPEEELNAWNYRGTQGIQLKSDPHDEHPWNGTNARGFNAVPTGYRSLTGSCYIENDFQRFYTSSPNSFGDGYIYRTLWSNSSGISRTSGSGVNHGFGVRCIKY